MASNRGWVFRGRGPLARFRHWRFKRRLDRILREANSPADRSIFTGNVSLQEVVYAPKGRLLTDVAQEEFEGGL